MFRFTIRDVLWLTVVVALGCGWAVYAIRSGDAREQIAELRAQNDFMRQFIAREYDSVMLTTKGEWLAIPKRLPPEPNP